MTEYDAATELENLKQEIERLTEELEEASNQKIQAAQYGLQVLEEKHQLQRKYDELETMHDATKNELETVQMVSIPLFFGSSILAFLCKSCILASCHTTTFVHF